MVTGMHGTYGTYTYGPHGRVPGISNLTIVTNLKTYGPFGVAKLEAANPINIPVKNNGSIVGFFAITGTYYVNSIGVYIKP